MTLFTEEQIKRAASVDLVDLLRKQNEELKREGSQYRWMRYDSTIICGNKWYRYSRERGGTAIGFMQEFFNMGFKDAVSYLLNGESGLEFVDISKIVPRKKASFIMPEISKNMRRTFAYLIKTRGIDSDVVNFFVKEKKIFETAQHHNIAFVGYDENGKIKQAHLRSTNTHIAFQIDVEGSDKKYYFRHIGTSNMLYIFEAPIDMLSFICLHKENWKVHSYVALGGVAIDAANNVLDTHGFIDKVFICTDNDTAGSKTAKRIGAELSERNICWQRLTSAQKDWNDDLKEAKGMLSGKTEVVHATNNDLYIGSI